MATVVSSPKSDSDTEDNVSKMLRRYPYMPRDSAVMLNRRSGVGSLATGPKIHPKCDYLPDLKQYENLTNVGGLCPRTRS